MIRLLIFVLLTATSIGLAGEPDLSTFLSQRCDAEENDHFVFRSLKSLDLNNDGHLELAAKHHGNNFTAYYFYFKTGCGYAPVVTDTDELLYALENSSSFSCAPHGCFSVLTCIREIDNTYLSIIELLGSEHAANLITDQTPPGYDFSSELTKTLYSYYRGVVSSIWQETHLYSEQEISEFQRSSKFDGCV